MKMYFVGVTTKQSSVMTLFPYWMRILGLDAVIEGVDIALRADRSEYIEVVEKIREDSDVLGALVTTHKIDLYESARHLFDYLCPYATKFGELSCISKRDGMLVGHAKDPISSGLALEAFLPTGFWDNGGDVFVMGAGGSSIALCSYILSQEKLPRKLIVSNRSSERLGNIERILRSYNVNIDMEFILADKMGANDSVIERLRPYSLIVNATGLGKDRPGSPLGDNCIFPINSLCWDFNYRGDLVFLQQAKRQKMDRNLHIEDGFVYFLHGWMQVVAEVFHIDISNGKFLEIMNESSILCGRNQNV